MQVWVIRAGPGGDSVNRFRQRGLVAVGFTGGESRPSSVAGLREHQIEQHIRRMYPREKPGTISAYSRMLNMFVNQVHLGDYVLTPGPPRTRQIIVGMVAGPCEFEEHATIHDFHHIRKVDWLSTVTREDLPNSVPVNLGGIGTVFPVSAEADVRRFLEMRFPSGTSSAS